ncbi:hypothetical protein ACFL7M_07345 [Thermodesulfobacteriota bacterium]
MASGTMHNSRFPAPVATLPPTQLGLHTITPQHPAGQVREAAERYTTAALSCPTTHPGKSCTKTKNTFSKPNILRSSFS